MTVQTLLFMLGITTEYSINVFQVAVAIWFITAGYALFKRANRALSRRSYKAGISVAQNEVSCLAAGTYRATEAYTASQS